MSVEVGAFAVGHVDVGVPRFRMACQKVYFISFGGQHSGYYGAEASSAAYTDGVYMVHYRYCVKYLQR